MTKRLHSLTLHRGGEAGNGKKKPGILYCAGPGISIDTRLFAKPHCSAKIKFTEKKIYYRRTQGQ